MRERERENSGTLYCILLECLCVCFKNWLICVDCLLACSFLYGTTLLHVIQETGHSVSIKVGLAEHSPRIYQCVHSACLLTHRCIVSMFRFAWRCMYFCVSNNRFNTSRRVCASAICGIELLVWPCRSIQDLHDFRQPVSINCGFLPHSPRLAQSEQRVSSSRHCTRNDASSSCGGELTQ